MNFSGNPRVYLKLAILGSLGIVLYLYCGLAAILYFGHGKTWMFGWKPILISLVFTVWFARLYYRWVMRLDAQYGTGKGWVLPAETVKLPEERTAH